MTPSHAFQGEVLLRLRRQREQERRHAMSQAQADVDTLVARIDDLKVTQAQYNYAARQALIGLGEPLDMELYRRRVADIQAALDHSHISLTIAREQLHRCRQDLRDAAAQAKAVANWKDRFEEKQAVQARSAGGKERDDLHAQHRFAQGGPAAGGMAAGGMDRP